MNHRSSELICESMGILINEGMNQRMHESANELNQRKSTGIFRHLGSRNLEISKTPNSQVPEMPKSGNVEIRHRLMSCEGVLFVVSAKRRAAHQISASISKLLSRLAKLLDVSGNCLVWWMYLEACGVEINYRAGAFLDHNDSFSRFRDSGNLGLLEFRDFDVSGG